MTCPFCGIPDERIGERHYERHQIEYLQRIAKALEQLSVLSRPEGRRAMTEKYNGWANYETWNVNLWLNNDEGTYREIRALCLDGNDEYAGSQKLQNFVMENILKVLDRFTENTYSGIVLDVSQANLKLVDWLEIWRGFRE